MNRYLIGTENLMWSSDYPHDRTTWPRSWKCVDQDLGGVDQEERRNIVRDNVLRVFGLESFATDYVEKYKAGPLDPSQWHVWERSA